MIESQTKFPARDRARAASGIRYRIVASSIRARIDGWHLTAKGAQGAHLVRMCVSVLRATLAELDLRSHLSSILTTTATGLRDGSLFGRFALHLVIVFLALGVVAITQITLPEVDFLLPTPTPAPELGERTVTTMTTNRGVDRLVGASSILFPAPVAHTVRAERDRMQVITYTVQPNDNVWAIAQSFGLQAETVLWANPKVESSPDLLSVGQVLFIPPVDGIYYTVQQGDTVEKLASTYQTTVEKIVSSELNALEAPYSLTPGQQLMLPDGRKKVVVATASNYYPMTKVGKAPAGAPSGSGKFAWPAQGYLSQRFWSGHGGIDIANRTGVPILAADTGYVVQAGRDTWGYGNQVLVDHGNGYYTRYAHLQKIHVKAGDSVSKNQQIGTMGCTGRCTGPHLHFEVI
jgi:murein DD-endopeptidase MepM/ murein hydrolase activator NlpD